MIKVTRDPIEVTGTSPIGGVGARPDVALMTQAPELCLWRRRNPLLATFSMNESALVSIRNFPVFFIFGAVS